MNSLNRWPSSKCFYETDLYTTFFGPHINDEIERILFGQIDNTGVKAVRAFAEDDMAGWHHHFEDFFSYMDSQKLRTPKGLDWIKRHYPNLGQTDLMVEMQAIRNLHCTIWTEGVREIVSAASSNVKFIVSDHPVTVYNAGCPPDSEHCKYPDEPSVALKGTQTIFPLDSNHCLILTNLEYAQNPEQQDPLEKRSNPRFLRHSMVRTDAFIRSRELAEDEVLRINSIIKRRARKYVAAANRDCLYPEETKPLEWAKLGEALLPPNDELYRFGGELYAGYDDGSTYYQDAFGRTIPENEHLKKTVNADIAGDDFCGCGSGRKYKDCCLDKEEHLRPTWDVRGIRERNLILYNAVEDILGFNEGKTWDDVRRELSNEQIIELHKLYGSIWTPDTDIFSLLPKPDGSLRAIYTGLLDPRVISFVALGAAPFFEEVLIQHPFTNPHSVRPKFNPIEEPHQYKQQTLQNIFLLLLLQPFVETGAVNFFPDPCAFDPILQRQVMDMAEQRSGRVEMNQRELECHKELFSQNLFRNKPRQIWEKDIKDAMPELSSEKVRELIEYMERQAKEDPLTLLQDDVFLEGGQLQMINLAPNFEMSLFLAQATGSMILTDSETRWAEFNAAKNPNVDAKAALSAKLTESLIGRELNMSVDAMESIRQRMEGDTRNFREAFREIFSVVVQGKENLDAETARKLGADLEKGIESAIASYDAERDGAFKAKFDLLMPNGGLVDNNVQRLLLKSGSQHHLMSTPLVAFVEPPSNK
ncbi:conserved protein of unknown function [uncultured Woeseiaceae bacterium]|uniref:SEC-C motif domain protein n=1 Tax=uncultured Woeseiaceae bacterium TaxID=1983305 RepID=A0A7D9D1H4_9GAMM|nr:conserved protein of unknown function [uncultured Woeseiaceae bacterium]